MTKKQAAKVLQLKESDILYVDKVEAYYTLRGLMTADQCRAMCEYEIHLADEANDHERKRKWAKELFGLHKVLMQKEVETSMVISHHYHHPGPKEGEDENDKTTD